MNKQLHFLSGVPRSGSTVLAAILNQNPATHASTTSGLVHA
jgi:sulfotransferase